MSLHTKINNIFNNNINKIKKEAKLRNKKITIQDTLFYEFLYSRIGGTKQHSVSSVNFDIKKDAHRTSYYRKEKRIPLSLYSNIYNDLKILFYEMNNNKRSDNKIICAVDGTLAESSVESGTYNNTNINKKTGTLQTSLNMGYYDCENGIPIELNFVSDCKKNGEHKHLQEWINKNNTKDLIITADRAYFTYDLFKLLLTDKNKPNFVIRIKENSQLKTVIKNSNTKKKQIDDIKIKTRIVMYEDTFIKKVLNKNKEYVNLECNVVYTLITNLTNKKKYSDQDILNIYASRWKIEEFFKYIKSNCNFNLIKVHSELETKKIMMSQLIIILIARIFEHLHLHKNKRFDTITKKINVKKGIKKNINLKCTVNINKSNLIKGVYPADESRRVRYDKLLKDIICGKLTNETILLLIKTYAITIKNATGRHFKRISLIPFTKWYVKGYLEIYKYIKILEAIENQTKAPNKNIKTKAKNKKIV